MRARECFWSRAPIPLTEETLDTDAMSVGDSNGKNLCVAILAGILLLVFVLPAILVVRFDASAGVIVSGAVMWGVSQAVKIPAHLMASRWLSRKLPKAAWAAIRGVVSAVSELAPSALCLVFFLPFLSLPSIVGFGVGASGAEILFVLAARFARRRKGRSKSRIDIGAAHTGRSPYVRYFFLVERTAALLLHIGSRCLVYTSLSQHTPWAGIWALISFSLVDGLAAYGKLRGWNWLDARISGGFFGFTFVVGASDLALFAATAQGFRH